jgi:CheY-like chemotaxis protein
VAEFPEKVADLERDRWPLSPKPAIKGINPAVPVIMATGWAPRIEQQRLRDSGVDLVVAKPFGVRELQDAVSEALKLKEREA